MRRFFLVFAVIVILGLVTSPAQSQIPDEFTNLRLLDPEIEKSELVSIMRDWAGGLGVRCNHCHVGPENLRGMDFASDEKATKRTARRMLSMSRAINGELLKELPVVAEGGRHRAQMVSCYTCHRGMTRPPRAALAELKDAAFEGGPEGGVARYFELVASHADAGRYDLRPTTLVWLANAYLEGDDPAGARKVLDGVLRIEPALAPAYATLARIEVASGRLGEAEAALARLVELDPEDTSSAWVGRMIERARARSGEAAGPSQASPAAVALQSWSFLVGRWEMQSTRYSFEGEAIEENPGSAEFAWELEGERLRERQSTTLGGRPMEVLNLFSVHPETKEWQIARTDSLHHSFNIMQGTGGPQAIVLAEKDPSPASSVARRWTYEKASDDAFSLRLEFSTDQGVSWFVRNQTRYQRRP